LSKLIFTVISAKSGHLFQQWYQLACAIKVVQVVATTHMRAANVNLRNGSAAGFGHHFFFLGRIEIYADLFDVLHTTLV